MTGKNEFLIYNEIIYSLNKCHELSDLQQLFFPKLRMLIPFSYASILLCKTDEKSANVLLHAPVCYPDFFAEAEKEYIKYSDKDTLLWLMHSQESTLIRESDLIDEEKRINSFLYKRCYSKYNIYDTLQYSITYEGKILGVLTLFRTKIDGTFSDEDMFYLRSCGMHLNLRIDTMIHAQKPLSTITRAELEALKLKYRLTARETELLSLIYEYNTINEMAERLSITEYTIQKHLQNIFNKMNVSSRWAILKIRP